MEVVCETTANLLKRIAQNAVDLLPRGKEREEMRVLDENNGFPPLPTFQIALRRVAGKTSPVLDRLEAHIIDSFQVALPLTVAA